jgi:hypothetical protein
LRISDEGKLFFDEIREKKKTASGVHHKKGKRGYVGKMLFPTDLMTRKEKYNHRKGGKVLTSNMYDTILSVDEFKDLETYEQKNRMQYWRSNNKVKTIQQEMGVSPAKFYVILNELGLPTDDKRKAKKTRSAKISDIQTVESVSPPIELLLSGLHLSFDGTFDAETIYKQITKYVSLLEGETDHYYVEFKLMQKVKKTAL